MARNKNIYRYKRDFDPYEWATEHPISSSIGVVLIIAFVAFLGNVAGVRDNICSNKNAKPFCKALGLPDPDLSIAHKEWEVIAKSASCDDFRKYLEKHPDNKFTQMAADRLQAKRTISKETAQIRDTTHNLSTSPFASTRPTQEDAKKATSVAAREYANKSLCNSPIGNERIISVEVFPGDWNCAQVANGYLCNFGANGGAKCSYETVKVKELQDCSR